MFIIFWRAFVSAYLYALLSCSFLPSFVLVCCIVLEQIKWWWNDEHIFSFYETSQISFSHITLLTCWRTALTSCVMSNCVDKQNVVRRTHGFISSTQSWKTIWCEKNKLCGRPPQYAPAPCDLDLLTLKVVSESRVPILVFPGRSVLDLGPMCATGRDRQTSDSIIA